MIFTYDMAERVAGFYRDIRFVEEELGRDMPEGEESEYSRHPQWDILRDVVWSKWSLTGEEQKLLLMAAKGGICDYFRAADVVQVMESQYGINPTGDE